MWRHRAVCKYCGVRSNWRQERVASEQEILRHLKDKHGVATPHDLVDYRLEGQRQCDSCLEPYVDDCTKCRQDFCRLHAGDIDGLCGGCI